MIDAEVEPVKGRAGRTEALRGRAGLEVAIALLMQPERSLAVRELARELGRSPSTVSDVLSALRRAGTIDVTNAVNGTSLFWEVVTAGPRHAPISPGFPRLETQTSPRRCGWVWRMSIMSRGGR